ncbi:MAG TPA: S8 family peptidase, partial [Longimicrobiaceae bacterium]|nr:S8 family peptidase [Longimicrobiaceae bacterium]
MNHLRNLVVLGSVAALAACSDDRSPLASTGTPAVESQTLAPVIATADPSAAVDGSYIVVLRGQAQSSEIASRARVAPRHTFEAVLNGFSAELTPAQVEALRHDPSVQYIEQDQMYHVATTQSGATWGIDRIDQRNLPLSGTYTYTSTGTGVRAYVIDTGIYTSHSQFGGRAAASYDAFGGSGQDCNGHGTHVAGTIGSATYGVAKNVYLRAVRVLDCSGSGATSGIIAGMNWVQTNATKPAVANMSLGGGYSSSLNTAATNLAGSGVFLAVAAGNENQAACNVSPASASGTLTVAATGSNDARASYSNYGGCVDVYAPGSSITSTWLNGGTNTISGTSMA